MADPYERGDQARIADLTDERDRYRDALERLIAATDPYGLDNDSTPFDAHTEFAAAIFAAKELFAPKDGNDG